MNTATTRDRNLLRQAPHPEAEMASRVTSHANLARLDDLRLRPGATIADPFRPTAHLTELLSLRASRLRGGSTLRRRLHWRPAYAS